jgi:hypothetical protein
VNKGTFLAHLFAEFPQFLPFFRRRCILVSPEIVKGCARLIDCLKKIMRLLFGYRRYQHVPAEKQEPFFSVSGSLIIRSDIIPPHQLERRAKMRHRDLFALGENAGLTGRNVHCPKVAADLAGTGTSGLHVGIIREDHRRKLRTFGFAGGWRGQVFQNPVKQRPEIRPANASASGHEGAVAGHHAPESRSSFVTQARCVLHATCLTAWIHHVNHSLPGLRNNADSQRRHG